ncbi:helix-turn-helix domain-containing protein [Butyricimonas paravirosa]|uniref:AraC-like DNA-binding protein n=2 Tax=Butyricimonas paravirosa TaxID=1472417 RepID=A0A7X5YHI5_9BACT|nr:helix-turn-helix domain-containing protein [Butyricimonas paravirosa]NJC20498.1 AraC-like DNA-binding protein [Butyricimonas paravirosa]
MWKQKLKICGINLAAYIVVLIIMAMLSVCSRLYGQEKPMLSPEHTKRIAPGIDTTKLPSFEYGKSFLSPHFGIIHKKPEMLLNFRPDYTLAYYTQENPFQSGLPTVAYCADQLCMSAGYLGDLVRRHTGDTAINYIHRFILQKAKSLLSAGKTITEVAYDLGFAYPQHLSRLFKKKEGLSPSEYVNGIR